MKRTLHKTALAVLVMLAGLTSAQAGNAKNPGKSIFQENCSLCHGDDGTAKTPPGIALGAHDLTSREVGKKPDTALAQTISQGRNKMPAFSDKLNDSQIHELILYIRTLEKK
jgi:mono/diheme cytochrome c family protein